MKRVLILILTALITACGSEDSKKKKIFNETPVPTSSLENSGCKVVDTSDLQCVETSDRALLQLRKDALVAFRDDLNNYLKIDRLSPTLIARASSLRGSAVSVISKVNIALIDVPRAEVNWRGLASEAERISGLATHTTRFTLNEYAIFEEHECELNELVLAENCQLSQDRDTAESMIALCDEALFSIDFILENDRELTGERQAELSQKAMKFEDLKQMYQSQLEGMDLADSL